MGANVNHCLRIAIVNQLIFLILTHIDNCDSNPYGCTKGEGLLQGLGYIIAFSSLAIIQVIMFLGLILTIYDKSILKATQLNAFVFLVSLALCIYTLFNWYYAHM